MRHAVNGPSPHDIMTGFFVPNSSDIGAGHKAGFGTTIWPLIDLFVLAHPKVRVQRIANSSSMII